MIFVSSKISDGNMSINYGNPKKALKNRKKFFKKLGINPENIVEVKQVHGNKVLLVDNILDPNIEADGLITNKAGVILMMKVADCMAISFYDSTHQAIGLVHAGYKGLEKGIIKNAIYAMNKNFKTNPKDLIIHFGPSIGPCCYRLDIWTKAEKQLEDSGVLKENINNPRICTYESKDYFSHRRSEDKNQRDFRFATILGLKNAN